MFDKAPDHAPDPHQARGKLAAIGLILVLVLGSLWLMRHLTQTAALQDCVASGRRDCLNQTP